MQPEIIPGPNATAAPGVTSTDDKYRRHEFTTWAGRYDYAAGWTPPRARAATDNHLRGWMYQSAALARDVVRYPPIMGALRQRCAPCLGSKWQVKGPSTAPGKYAVEDLQGVWDKDFRPTYETKLRELALMGLSIVHVHWVPDVEKGVEIPVLKRWPHEAIVFREPSPAFAGGYYASTNDGLVRIVPNDGHWIVLAQGERPHEFGAILALDLCYVGGQLARRDEAGLSEAAGRASPIAELPPAIAVNDEIGKSVQDMVAGLGLARKGAVVPNGTKVLPVQFISDTGFFVAYSSEQITLVSFAILGQSGTMAAGSGGVYTAPVYADVAVSLNNADHEATERGWNLGLAKPYAEINGQAEVTTIEAERQGDPDGEAKRATTFGAVLTGYKTAGLAPTQEDVDDLADRMQVRTIALATAAKKPEIFAYHIQTQQVSRDEVRATLDLPPLPDKVGSVEHMAETIVAQEAAETAARQAGSKATAPAAPAAEG